MAAKVSAFCDTYVQATIPFTYWQARKGDWKALLMVESHRRACTKMVEEHVRMEQAKKWSNT